MRTLFPVFLLILVALAPSAFGQSTPLTVHVAETSVKVFNLTPGGDVVLVECARMGRNGRTINEARPRLLHDDDGDGIVTLPGDVPYVSVWIAVDYKTGKVATGAPEGVEPWVRPISENFYRKDADEQILALEQEIHRMLLLIVRPEKGAWSLRAREGDDGDRDNEPNNRLLMAFEDAKPLEEGKEQAPRHLKAGDVVVAVDLGHYDIFVGEVTK
jgi:hypothetical protein